MYESHGANMHDSLFKQLSSIKCRYYKKWQESMFSIKNKIKLSWLSKVNFFGKWSTKAQFATKIFKLKIISKSRKITQEILTT